MADMPPTPDSNSDTRVGLDRESPPGTPRWVKVFGIVVLILLLLAAIIIFTGIGGEHGPGRHMRSGDTGGSTPPIGRGVQQA